jgi:hypothetical protein
MPFRVNRLGEFLPIVWLFTLGSFNENHTRSPHFGLLFSVGKVVYQIWRKVGWATFWAILKRTYPVILMPLTAPIEPHKTLPYVNFLSWVYRRGWTKVLMHVVANLNTWW